MSNAHPHADTVLLVTDDGMGRGAPELRHKLIRSYLQLLLGEVPLPGAICFYSDGVRMVTRASPVLELLAQLEEKGVLLLSCATCLNHYALADQVAVGIIGSMHDILTAQWEADKVITL